MLNKFSHTLSALFILFFMGVILLIPKVCIEGASSGLVLWAQKLLPSLLPFIILINLLCYLGIIFKLSSFLHPLTQFFFNISGTSFLIFITGLIAGYPMGAKLIRQLLDTRQLSSIEAQKTLCFSTNCGPLFIIGTVGTLMLKNPNLGYFLAFIHILSSFMMLLLSRFYILPKEKVVTSLSEPSHSNTSFSQAFSLSVQNGMETIINVGGYIIFFSMIINILAHSHFFKSCIVSLSELSTCSYDTLYQVILGSLEFSNGSALLSHMQPFSLHHLALLCALISFGGFCVFFQCTYILSGTPLKLSLYLISKLLQACLTYCLVFLLYPLCYHTPPSASIYLICLLVLCFLTATLFRIFSYYQSPTQ